MTQDYFPLKYMYKTVTSKFFFNKILEFSSSGFGVIRDDCHLLNATCCSRSSLDGGEAFLWLLSYMTKWIALHSLFLRKYYQCSMKKTFAMIFFLIFLC